MCQLSTLVSLDDKVEVGSPDSTGNQVVGKPSKAKSYKKYNNNDVIMEALAFYILHQLNSFYWDKVIILKFDFKNILPHGLWYNEMVVFWTK